MARGILLKNNLTKNTLIKIAQIGLIAVSITSPYFLHQLAKQYFKDKTTEIIRQRARKLKELQKRKLIEFKELPDGSIKIVLSHRGQNAVRKYKLDEMKIIKPKKWDKKWRIIIYDIPKSQKRNSDVFREKIKNLGLYQLQKSVWTSPYECLPEIEFLCAVFDINIDKCVCYFKAEEIPAKKEIEKFFNL